MKFQDFPAYVRDTALRMLPHRAPTGLIRIGNPGRSSPLLVTGNFALTVRRLRDALRGHDCWLLVANSKGINVWCAAGGGHLTHHDIISAMHVSRIETLVDHREIILPQLCATGVERRRIAEATGFQGRWGPARLEDLAGFLDRGARVRNNERFMRFPAWERMEIAAMWVIPMLIVGLPILIFLAGFVVALSIGAAIAIMVSVLFLLIPWLIVDGPMRYVTFTAFVVMAFSAGLGILAISGSATAPHAEILAVSCLVAMAILSTDLTGTTPWYGGYINRYHNNAKIELVEDRCSGKAECVQVCPRDVLKMAGRRRKVDIANPDQCIQCGACIVQCPEDALRFRYDDGRVAEATTVRRTRMNMLGRRSIRIPD